MLTSLNVPMCLNVLYLLHDVNGVDGILVILKVVGAQCPVDMSLNDVTGRVYQ